ncbi:hypothetical protein G7Y89_g6669 [Cudoniella acicularis]|uniref:Transposase n=1 Tax=Cudoniella acicularis TaxID=354080 RepID=A0A8H4RNF6_9HELO|nr:hypothetical protein G7Y89_g6669 [Cudoniella acicularis]
MKRIYTEEDVMRALDAVAGGATISGASRDYGVPRGTLQERLKGRQSHQEAARHLQKLSPVQEKRLTDWVLVQESLGLSPTHTQIKDFAQRILATRGDTTTLGKKWLRAFLKRNPIHKTKKQVRIDSVRINGATTDIIKAWFQKLEVPEIKAIKPHHRWNMDEAGIMEGQGINGLVAGSTDRRFIQRKQPGSKGWTSFIKCVSATGVTLPPLVIFKGKTVQQQWFPTNLDSYKNWQFTATENGWTSDETALEKVVKGFDEKDFDLAQANLRIKQLEARVEQLEPRKRRRVKTSPNSKFADIRAIRQAQIEAGDREIEEDNSNIAVDSDSTVDYVEVQES